MRVYAVVPVSQFEPESVVTKSIECLKQLECDNFNFEVYYLIETFPGDRRTLSWVLPDNFSIKLRTPRGRKAGALNDFFNMVTDADYVAIFDVDGRPAKDYIVKCVAALEEDESAVISTGCLFINNANSVLTKVISINYALTYTSYSFSSGSGFFAIGGGGVMKASLLQGEKFNEETSVEDFDFMTRLYLKGKVPVLANTVAREQAPTTLKDLYHQRVRWFRGMAEGFGEYLAPMIKAPIPFIRKISWLSVIMASFCLFLSTPLTISLFLANRHDVRKLSNAPLDGVKILLGCIGYAWFLTACGLIAILQHITLNASEWQDIIRSDV